MRKLALLLLAMVTVCGLSLGASEANGPAKLTPEKPRWGDIITLSYDPAAKGAVFLPGDEIYVYWTVATDGSSEQGWARMEKKGDIFQSNPLNCASRLG
jgi:hypothetical protein